MSHEATNWAVKQRGIGPAAKVVLWHLCDRHHPDHGCFPSQERLAEDCEMSRASVNNQLAKLEAAGLIRRERRVDAMTKRQRSTRYILGFEAGFTQVRVQKLDTASVSKKAADPCPNLSESRVQILDTNTVRGTSKGNSKNTRETLLTFLSPQVADDFIEHRRAKRAKLSPRAAELIARKLEGHPNPDAVVNESIQNGWTGVFPRPQQKGNESGAERAKRIAALSEQGMDSGTSGGAVVPLLSARQPG